MYILPSGHGQEIQKKPPLKALSHEQAEKLDPHSSQRIKAKDIDKDVYVKTIQGKAAAVTGAMGYVVRNAVSSFVKYGVATAVVSGLLGSPFIAAAGVGAACWNFVKTDVKGGAQDGVKYGSIAGGFVGKGLGHLLHKLRVPLKESSVAISHDYDTKEAVSRIKNFNYSSLPRVDQQSVKELMNDLKPGDIILARNYSSKNFGLLANVPGLKQDYNRVLLYKGDGIALEPNTGDGEQNAKSAQGMAEIDLASYLEDQHRVCAVRPNYQEGQVDDLFAGIDAFLDSKTNVALKYTSNTIYSAQSVDELLKRHAPQVKFRDHGIFNKDVFLIQDFLKGSENEVVGQLGVDPGVFSTMMSKLT